MMRRSTSRSRTRTTGADLNVFIWITGTLALLASVPVFAWLTGFFYAYFQPLDMPIDLNRTKDMMRLGLFVAGVIAFVGMYNLTFTSGPQTW